MCDGYRDDTEWTIQLRASGRLILTPSGHSYSFSDEADARAFLVGRPDAETLEVAPIPSPENP